MSATVKEFYSNDNWKGTSIQAMTVCSLFFNSLTTNFITFPIDDLDKIPQNLLNAYYLCEMLSIKLEHFRSNVFKNDMVYLVNEIDIDIDKLKHDININESMNKMCIC